MEGGYYRGLSRPLQCQQVSSAADLFACMYMHLALTRSLYSLLDQVYVRQELWKYRRVFDGYEKRWMSTPFKKLDINLLSTKVRIVVLRLLAGLKLVEIFGFFLTQVWYIFSVLPDLAVIHDLLLPCMHTQQGLSDWVCMHTQQGLSDWVCMHTQQGLSDWVCMHMQQGLSDWVCLG